MQRPLWKYLILWRQRKLSATWSQVRRATASVVLCAQVSAADCITVLRDSAATAAAAAAAAEKWFGRRVPKSSTLRYYCMPSVDGDCCPSQVINILLEKLKRSLQLGYTFRLRLDAVRLRFDVEQQSSGCRIAVEWESNGVRQIEVGSKPNRRRNHA